MTTKGDTGQLEDLIVKGEQWCSAIMARLSREPTGYYAVINTDTGEYVVSASSEEASALYCAKFTAPGYGYRIGQSL